MAEVTLELETAGWEQMIRSIFDGVKNAQKLLTVAAQAFAFQDIIAHFRDESGPDGQWMPRKDETQKRYAMIQQGLWQAPRGMRPGSFSPTNKLLQLTGHLRQSIVPRNVERVGDRAIRIFANATYSARHNDGTDGMPKREFMWLSSDAQDKMAGAMAQMLAELAEGGEQ